MKEEWYITLGRFGFWMLSRVLLPIVFVALPVIVIVGVHKPDIAAVVALHLTSDQKAVLVGVGGEVKCIGESCSHVSTHTYLIWPGLSGAAVSETGDGLRAEAVPGAGFIVLSAWLVGGWCVWRYWVKPIATNLSLGGRGISHG